MKLCNNGHDEACYDPGTLMHSNECPACAALDELVAADAHLKDARARIVWLESLTEKLRVEVEDIDTCKKRKED